MTIDELERLVTTNRQLPAPATRRALREGAGVSVRQLASALGVSRQCIYFWEAGRRHPGVEHRAQYVDALRILAGRERP